MSSQNYWKCDRCGVTSFGDGTDESPEGWDYMSYGEKETNGVDICPACGQSFRDWLKGDLHGIEVGKHIFACTCPKTKVNDPFSTSSVIGWTYRPCPLHPIQATL